jgi:hypothetical protein
MATGLYVRAFCDLLDMGWGAGAQFAATSLALVVAAVTATWAGEAHP